MSTAASHGPGWLSLCSLLPGKPGHQPGFTCTEITGKLSEDPVTTCFKLYYSDFVTWVIRYFLGFFQAAKNSQKFHRVDKICTYMHISTRACTHTPTCNHPDGPGIPPHTPVHVTQHQTWNSQVHHTDRHHCAAINVLINAVMNVEINAERRSKTWQRDHRELLAAGDCRGSATYLRASLQKTAKALRSLLSAFSAAPPGSISTVYVILTKPFLLFWGEMAA